MRVDQGVLRVLREGTAKGARLRLVIVRLLLPTSLLLDQSSLLCEADG